MCVAIISYKLKAYLAQQNKAEFNSAKDSELCISFFLC